MSDYGTGYRDGKRHASVEVHTDLIQKDREIERLLATVMQDKARIKELESELYKALEYFEEREDISDETTDDGHPLPGEEMILASSIRESLGISNSWVKGPVGVKGK